MAFSLCLGNIKTAKNWTV